MSVSIRYRLAPGDPWTETEINRDDPFEVCNAVRSRIFPNTPLPERDLRFEAVMAARNSGARQVPASSGDAAEQPAISTAAAATALPRAGVRDTSMHAYRSLEWDGRLTKQQKRIVDFLQANLQRDYTRNELANATGLPINTICGRVKELLDFKAIEEFERRDCRITGATANPVRIALWMRKAA